MLTELLETLKKFAESASIEEQRAAIEPLARLYKRLSIRIMTEIEQRTALVIAMTNNDRSELRAIEQHTQHDELRSWAKEALAPRTVMSKFSL
jgi:hypothetical protein